MERFIKEITNGKYAVKLAEMGKEAGIKSIIKEIKKKFAFELKNNVVSYDTLVKLRELIKKNEK